MRHQQNYFHQSSRQGSMSFATEFLDGVGHEHKDDVKLYSSLDTGKPWLRCTRCDWQCDVYAYVASPPGGGDFFLSSRLAETYARWTGDVNVPVSFHLVPSDFEGIVATRPLTVPLRLLSNAVQLQRLVNAPFVTESQKEAPQPKIFQNFLREYMSSVAGKAAAESSSEELVLSQLLKSMENLLHTDVDIFEYYRHTLVPYVTECCGGGGSEFPLPVDVEKELTCPLSMQMLYQWRRAAAIRRTHSKYSVAFDVVHVMIACYACSSDTSVVANFAFDLMGRVCRGDFFHVETEGKQRVRKLLDAHASLRTNAELYYALREMRNGQAMEGLSTLLPKYAKLERLVKDHLPNDQVRGQAFPAVVFGDDNADYLGFVMALAHVGMHVDSKGTVPKGVYATARRIHRVVRQFVERMKAFNDGPDKLPWTMDVFQAFLASDAELEKHVREIAQMVIVDGGREETRET